jgi:integrating conjugative element protein (TIGR03756 family)
MNDVRLRRDALWRILAIVLGLLIQGAAKALDTASIIASAASLSCANVQPVGVCYWLVCTPFGCEVETSAKIGHYNPDLVVSATNGLGKNPWIEMRGVLAGLETAGTGAVIASMGGITTALARTGGITAGAAGSPGQRRNLAFKEAQALGHPAAGQIYCPSAAQPYAPYYLSGLDAVGWRWEIPEVIYPESLVPGLREIGHWPLNTWGSVYPRSGWLIQGDEPKAAAVLAQRVGDLVTRSGSPRIYTPLDSGGVFVANGKLAWRPPPLRETNARTGTWQRLAPTPGASCAVFGRNDLASPAGWSGGQLASNGDYAWTLWRPYACCEVKGTFLGYTDFTPFP